LRVDAVFNYKVKGEAFSVHNQVPSIEVEKMHRTLEEAEWTSSYLGQLTWEERAPRPTD
jgi:hypothetical protein